MKLNLVIEINHDTCGPQNFYIQTNKNEALSTWEEILVDLKHHILRISRDEWIRQVYDVGKYYSGMIGVKGWQIGSTVVFLKKVGKKDSVIGHGSIAGIETIDDMSEEEKKMCQENGWKSAVRFADLKKLEPAKPINETAIGKWGARGQYLHGRALSNEELETILV